MSRSCPTNGGLTRVRAQVLEKKIKSNQKRLRKVKVTQLLSSKARWPPSTLSLCLLFFNSDEVMWLEGNCVRPHGSQWGRAMTTDHGD